MPTAPLVHEAAPAPLPIYLHRALDSLKKTFSGDIHTDDTLRRLYATDASAYREIPLAVALPRDEADIEALIRFARRYRIALIPRTAGTSLAGQVLGKGIVVDVSQYFNQILEINAAEGWVRVQPGVVRDELNRALKAHGLMFAPETSTANRAMIGGMIGNNSCGSNSVVYGSVREHLMAVEGFLSNGERVRVASLSLPEYYAKQSGDALEQRIYRGLHELLSQPENQEQILREFPKPNIPRRNTGYALDMLLRQQPYNPDGSDFNLCALIAGSEGTLMFITQATLRLVPLPPAHTALVCAHFESIDESLRANLICVQHQPSAVELIDHYVLDCTRDNLEQSQNRFFVEGNPKAILVTELHRDTPQMLAAAVEQLIAALREAGLGYAYPVVQGTDTKRVWDLRKAGLGLLSNLRGDAKPVAVIEDTAVDVEDLPAYIAEFNQILREQGLYSVHYAHAGSGELHLRPILNLKTPEGVRLFRQIATDIAHLVKKYRGSLSGEHGDGRLRGEFIPLMLGEHNYALLRRVKALFDPENIFNPHKIVDTPPMDAHLRYPPAQATPQFDTVLDFSATDGLLRMAEQCNGSGDCRKSHLTGGAMCPSYQATRREQDSTRARANILREILTNARVKNPFAHPAIAEVMDLCLSCKGCKSECPSNVDVGKMKAEYLYQQYRQRGLPWRTWVIGNYSLSQKLGSLMPGVYNWLISNRFTAYLLKKTLGFATARSLPPLYRYTLRRWAVRHLPQIRPTAPKGKVYLFIDEFTNYNDTAIGIKAIELLCALGYEPLITPHTESGRAYLSKGMLGQARRLAAQNIAHFAPLVSPQTPLVGIEPSAILGFRDEYIDLVRGDSQVQAREIAKHTYTLEEFLAHEADKGNVNADMFTDAPQHIKIHGHCHQKALSSLSHSKKILQLPRNYRVEIIPSGCCGMAGSFGYEAKHYAISQQIGELVLLPAVRAAPPHTIIAAAGTSCRHQIKDATQVLAQHPAELLWAALNKQS